MEDDIIMGYIEDYVCYYDTIKDVLFVDFKEKPFTFKQLKEDYSVN